MSCITKIAIATVLAVLAIATFYVYWARTPQYTLLRVLDAYAKADHERVALYIEKPPPLNNTLHVQRRTESVIQYLAGIQNVTLARAYRITVDESRLDGKTAVLHIRLNQMAYRLTFHEQKDGGWKLIEFDKREAFSQQAVKSMKDHPLPIIARL